MNSRILTITLVVLTMALGACSSMGPEECAATDWSAIGYEDGSRGMPTDYFSNHRKACAKHGVTADFPAYKAGRNEGLVEFCQPSRGYNLGVSGGRYHGGARQDQGIYRTHGMLTPLSACPLPD